MDSLLEANVSEEVAEDILVLFDIDVTLVGTNLQTVLLLATELFVYQADVPCEARDHDANNFSRICDGSNQIVRQLPLALLLSVIG